MATKKTARYIKKAKTSFREWVIRALTALLSALLGIGGAYSYATTGLVIPRRELLSGEASFHFVDVGQGDATLILTGDAAVLIDTGTDGAAGVLTAYLEAYAGRLDYLILTHPHDDHVGGADEVLDAVPVGRILMPLVEGDPYTDTITSLSAEYGVPLFDARAGSQYTAGDITCTFLGPVHTEYENLNNDSAVIRVDVGGVSLLVSGDAEAEAELDVLAANDPALLDCDIYKAGHHGSSTSSSLEFYTAISPDHCVISCGAGNSYGHPHSTVTSLISLSGAAMYRTDKEGTVVLETDGSTIRERGTVQREKETDTQAAS